MLGPALLGEVRGVGAHGQGRHPAPGDMVDGINEAVGRKAETLPAPVVRAILVARPRSLTRAIHRRQHLDQVERALAG
jgi:hypothetical protein